MTQSGKPEIDWELVERDYRAGIKSLREMAATVDITEGAIRKRAKRDLWIRCDPLVSGEKRIIDWSAVAVHYRAGIRSLKHIGREYGVSDAGIIKRAKRDCWLRDTIGSSGDKQNVVLETKDHLDSSGFIYVIFIDSGLDRFYKIGMSKQFSSRFDAHQCASPFEIRVALCYFTGNMRVEERRLHIIYADKRVRGEWFTLDDSDLASIAQRAVLV